MGRKKKAEPELDLSPYSTRETKPKFKVDDLIRDTGNWIIWERREGEEPRWMHRISKVICRQREVLLREGLSGEEPVRTVD